ncbi:PepSY-like domain-containing protein [Vaginella massiliensis]|uniref:PepSY-like domain-containing protein n=1 Tax=Vaginella massiliensis TaxID=1816680 RepID=UPI003753A1AD
MKLKNAILGFAIMLGANAFAQKTTVATSELPESARTFIVNNFGKNKIAHATKESKMGRLKEYKVYLNNGTKIEFDANGNWEEIDAKQKAVPNKIIPQKIVNHVKKAFPRAKIVKIERDRKGFDVELSNGLDLKFNPQADFLRIED